MKTLTELGDAIIQVREAINQLEVKGVNNAGIVLFCNKKCDELVKDINEAIKTAPPGEIELHIEEQAADGLQNGKSNRENVENRGD